MLSYLNKKDFSGWNWLVWPVIIIVFGSAGYVVYLLANEIYNSTLVILYFVAGLTLFLVIGQYLSTKINMSKIKMIAQKNSEEITQATFGSIIVNENIDIKNLTFGGNYNMKNVIDVVLGLTTNNKLYLIPTFGYTKRSLLAIPLRDIKSIRADEITMKRLQVGGLGAPTMVNDVNKSLDETSPMKEAYLQLETEQGSLFLLIHKPLLERIRAEEFVHALLNNISQKTNN